MLVSCVCVCVSVSPSASWRARHGGTIATHVTHMEYALNCSARLFYEMANATDDYANAAQYDMQNDDGQWIGRVPFHCFVNTQFAHTQTQTHTHHTQSVLFSIFIYPIRMTHSDEMCQIYIVHINISLH